MSGLLQDIRYALGAMRGSPGLTVVIVASLAVGLGANTAIFSVINALLLKPRPYSDPERLAVIWIRNRASVFRAYGARRVRRHTRHV